MDIPLVLQIILVLMFIHEVSTQNSSVALPGCQEKCGNVNITYPFGIGRGCSLDWRMQIYCNTTFDPPKPFLKYSRLEVLLISVKKRTIQVMNPVLRDCTTEGETQQGVFVEDPFTFSATQNLFIAMGCNIVALMQSENRSNLGGCLSFCNEKRDQHNCFGINCCQTLIPESLGNFRTSLRTFNIIAPDQDFCKHAFIVDKNWFGKLQDIYSVQNLKLQVPAVLDWKIGLTENCYPLESTNTSKFLSGKGSVCGRNAFCIKKMCYCMYGYEGNPYLPDGCQDVCAHNNTLRSYNCAAKVHLHKVNKAPAVLAIATCGGLAVLLVLAATWWLCKVTKRREEHKLKKKNFEKNGGLLLRQQVSSSEGNVETTKLFTSKELEMATDHYNKDRILGQGGQGTVYKGMLTDGKIVAVKKSKIEDESKKEQFINEVVLLSQINHRNIVKLHGCCLETEVPLLVYEFIPNGTLLEYIRDHNVDFPLTWDIRLRVAIEIAGALFYLHSAASIPIFHRDIKSSNILLDEKYRAKMADFGTSKSIAIDQTHMTTRVQGTWGYLDPEYCQSSQFTDKSDVYSFGIVLVELLTGKKAILTPGAPDEGRSLAIHFKLTMDENSLFDILDPLIAKESRKEEITTFANIAYRCLNMNGRKRPTMKQVATELESIIISGTLSTEEQQCEEDEYPVPEHLNGAWDLTSTSMSSSTSKSVKVDAQPFNRTY